MSEANASAELWGHSLFVRHPDGSETPITLVKNETVADQLRIAVLTWEQKKKARADYNAMVERFKENYARAES